MAIKLKNNESANQTDGNEMTPGSFEPSDNLNNQAESKYHGGLGDGKVDIDKINDLPAYTAPPVMGNGGTGAASGSAKRSIIYKVIGIIIILIALVFMVKGIRFMTGSGGKDITDELSKSESELASDFKTQFTDNPARVSAIPQYCGGDINVKSGKDLHIVYYKDKQIGLNTDSRKYRLFGVGINDPEKTAIKKMTYQYDDCIAILNDLMGGSSDTYFYYNKKNNDCFVLTINKNSARVVNMTYYNDFKKVTSTLTMN